MGFVMDILSYMDSQMKWRSAKGCLANNGCDMIKTGRDGAQRWSSMSSGGLR